MSKAAMIASGILAGTTTKLARTVARRAMHDRGGAPRVPGRVRYRNGIGVMLAWAAAVGVMLALADVLREQRKVSTPGT